MAEPKPDIPADHAATGAATTLYSVKRVPLTQIARVFLYLGVLGFGGPAAHIALMERELVSRRGWLSREYFLDLLAAINLVPGPNSTEMAFYIGYIIGGLWGAILSGAGFIVPATVFSIALAMVYVNVGTVPAIRGLFVGLTPVILALILSAGYRLGRKAIDSRLMLMLCLGALLCAVVGSTSIMGLMGLKITYIPELAILLAVGLLYVLIKQNNPATLGSKLFIGPLFGLGLNWLQDTFPIVIPSLLELCWRFFVIGATLFGSGYLIASYMQRTIVDGLHWLTPQQLLDVLAIGQSTPGPVSSTVSAAGYVITAVPGQVWSGVPGALAATLGVFLPAFLIVLLLGRIVPYLRRYPVSLDFLKGVNAGVIALLVTAFLNLAIGALVRSTGFDWITLVLTGLAFLALERLNWSPLLLIIVAAVVGLLRIPLGL